MMLWRLRRRPHFDGAARCATLIECATAFSAAVNRASGTILLKISPANRGERLALKILLDLLICQSSAARWCHLRKVLQRKTRSHLTACPASSIEKGSLVTVLR